MLVSASAGRGFVLVCIERHHSISGSTFTRSLSTFIQGPTPGARCCQFISTVTGSPSNGVESILQQFWVDIRKDQRAWWVGRVFDIFAYELQHLESVTSVQQTYASDPKYKKYTQQVEKCLNSFDNVHEWADCIAFLKQLLKVSKAKIVDRVIVQRLPDFPILHAI